MVMSLGNLQMFEVSSSERSVSSPPTWYQNTNIYKIYTHWLTDFPPSDFQLLVSSHRSVFVVFTIYYLRNILIFVFDKYGKSVTENMEMIIVYILGKSQPLYLEDNIIIVIL